LGIIYHPKQEKAIAFSHELEAFLNKQGISAWLCSAWEPENARPHVAGTDMILSIGGDGTILRTARIVIPDSVPILGINLGRLGFMTELKASEAIDILPRLFSGDGWIEERAILEAKVSSHSEASHALNDVFIGRRSSARLVTIECKIDGEILATYRADGVVVATATGSTGYSLAAGGPILLKPVSPHFTFNKALVLPPQTVIEFKVNTNHEAMISNDGQMESPLTSGEQVRVKLSPYVARFIRVGPKTYFYQSLEARLRRNIS
jgi:NAD+ kinase